MDFIKAIEVIESNYPPENYTQLRQSLDMAMSALEKQIAKKVAKHTDKGIDRYFCPACGRLYWDKSHIFNYCNSCGQKLNLDVDGE